MSIEWKTSSRVLFWMKPYPLLWFRDTSLITHQHNLSSYYWTLHSVLVLSLSVSIDGEISLDLEIPKVKGAYAMFNLWSSNWSYRSGWTCFGFSTLHLSKGGAAVQGTHLCPTIFLLYTRGPLNASPCIEYCIYNSLRKQTSFILNHCIISLMSGTPVHSTLHCYVPVQYAH